MGLESTNGIRVGELPSGKLDATEAKLGGLELIGDMLEYVVDMRAIRKVLLALRSEHRSEYRDGDKANVVRLFEGQRRESATLPNAVCDRTGERLPFIGRFRIGAINVIPTQPADS